MKRLSLSPEAERDLDEIKHYLTEEGSVARARYVLREIRRALIFLSRTPGAGHLREDLSDAPVKF